MMNMNFLLSCFIKSWLKNHSYHLEKSIVKGIVVLRKSELRLQGTVVECVTSCMVIVLEGCGFKATGESKRLKGDWSPLLFELVARTKLNF